VYRAALDPVWQMKEGTTIDAALAEQMIPLADRFFELCRRHGVTRTKEISPHRIELVEQRLKKLFASTGG